MRVLKTHSHTSERLGYEARKNAKKTIEGKCKRYDKVNHRQKPHADRQRGGGERDEERRTPARNEKVALVTVSRLQQWVSRVNDAPSF